MNYNRFRLAPRVLALFLGLSAWAQTPPIVEESLSVSPEAGLPAVERVPPVSEPVSNAHPSRAKHRVKKHAAKKAARHHRKVHARVHKKAHKRKHSKH